MPEASADNNPPPEVIAPPEAPRQETAARVETSTSTLLTRKIEEIKDRPMPEDPSTPEYRSQALFHNLEFFARMKEGDIPENGLSFTTDKDGKPNDDNPIMYAKTHEDGSSEVVQLTTLRGVEGDEVICRARTLPKEGSEEELQDEEIVLPRGELMRSVVYSEREAALDAFDDPHERHVLETGISQYRLEGPEDIHESEELTEALDVVDKRFGETSQRSSQGEAAETESLEQPGSMEQAQAAIDRQRNNVQSSLEGMGENAEARREAQLVLAQLDMAREASKHDGEWRSIPIVDGLLSAQRYAGKHGDHLMENDKTTRDSLDALKPVADESVKALLKDAHLSQEQLDLIQQQGVAPLLNDEKVLERLPDLQQKLFGSMSTEDVQSMVQTVSENLSEDQKSRIQELMKKGGKGLLWAVLIAAGVTVAAGVGVTVAGAKMASAGARQ